MKDLQVSIGIVTVVEHTLVLKAVLMITNTLGSVPNVGTRTVFLAITS